MEWNWDASILAGVAIWIGLYLYGIWPQREGMSYWRPALFIAGSLILLLSLVSPLDSLSDKYLFSAHMVQHMLLALVVPLFWIVGLPDRLADRLLRPRIVQATWQALVFPVTALLIFDLDMWLWHLPVFYDLALAHERVHILQHLSFLAAGFINWWPIFSPSRRLPSIRRPLQLIYLAVGMQAMLVLGAILVFSRGPLYQPYVDAPRIFGITPLADQQIGGLIMWVPTSMFYLVLMSIIFFSWMAENEETALPT